MLKGFKDFISRGNVVDLAVGLIMGAAFSAIVASLVGDVVTPLIGAIFGRPDFSGIALGPDRDRQVHQRRRQLPARRPGRLLLHRRPDEPAHQEEEGGSAASAGVPGREAPHRDPGPARPPLEGEREGRGRPANPSSRRRAPEGFPKGRPPSSSSRFLGKRGHPYSSVPNIALTQSASLGKVSRYLWYCSMACFLSPLSW